MSDYSICIISPPGYAHSATFNEVAIGLQDGFKELGYAVPIVTDPAAITGQGIVLGANIAPKLVPPGTIVFNLEQAKSGWLNEDYLHALQRARYVWDYSNANIEVLSALVHTSAITRCGIGYSPTLNRIPVVHPDIDVLFYGSIFGRRVPILDRIRDTGLRVHWAFAVYGLYRDELIARSKIVVNLHAYEERTFEIVRVSYLLNNGRFVLSEPSTDVPGHLQDAVMFSAAENLPDLCIEYVRDYHGRQRVAARGAEAFRSITQAQYLREVLTAQT